MCLIMDYNGPADMESPYSSASRVFDAAPLNVAGAEGSASHPRGGLAGVRPGRVLLGVLLAPLDETLTAGTVVGCFWG